MGWKEAYQEKADAQLREWQARIELYKSEPIVFRQGRLIDRRRSLQRLEESFRIARESLDELTVSRGNDWEFAKQAVERSMIDLKRALDESGAGKVGGGLQIQTSRSHLYEPFGRKE
jgi:hypothetical protein